MEEGKAHEIAERLADEGQAVLIVDDSRSNYLYEEALMMAVKSANLPYILRSETPMLNKLMRPAKAKTKCLLPKCENMTNHNKGFCSPECFIIFKNK